MLLNRCRNPQHVQSHDKKMIGKQKIMNLNSYAHNILMVVGRQRPALANQHACSMMVEMLQACWLANAGRQRPTTKVCNGDQNAGIGFTEQNCVCILILIYLKFEQLFHELMNQQQACFYLFECIFHSNSIHRL